jgi:vacuolar-type H+-ATPase subunit I/STV1
MNNIFLPGNDPLLYSQSQYYPQQFHDKMEQRYNEYIGRAKQMPDKLSELDIKLKNLNSSSEEKLKEDAEFIDLSNTLQAAIQSEIMLLVKQQINSNPEMVKNIDRQITIIKNIESSVSEAERKNIAELNDYLKNYSNMTFDEYKKLKDAAYEKR